jgi:5-(carboxyamino)imidazole ribonucleotide synthase
MMALAGWNLCIKFSFLAEADESTRCVEGLGSVARRSGDATAREIFMALGAPDVVTVERENVDLELLRGFEPLCSVYPGADAVAVCGNRALEKGKLDELSLPTAPYQVAHTVLQVADAAAALGLPVVVKSLTEGYDGKAQWRLHSEADVQAFCRDYSTGNWLVEAWVDFQREVSFIAARSASGGTVIYPPAENVHRDGILLTSVAPAPDFPETLRQQGEHCIGTLLEALDYVGVLAMECFVTADGLLINELAPRVHNSGHWTLRSEATSQFENHLRAITGLSLGTTRTSGCDAILNILGEYDREATLRSLGACASLTDYDKRFAPGRKVGHINVSGRCRDEVLEELARLHFELYDSASRTAGAHHQDSSTCGSV